MSGKVLVRFFGAIALVAVIAAGQVFAGGPICPPQGCPPPMCPPQMCPPPICAPPPCPPPACGPPRCGPGPIAQILLGAVRLVTGVVALPFRVVDALIYGPECWPRRCRPMVACGPPPMCPPPVCPPPMCWQPPPVSCPPYGYGYGMAPSRPVGFGVGAPRRFAPMAKKKSVPSRLIAGSVDGIFGAYW
jgi:hypothetical protein